ncbi:MAG TPA: NADH-quinone oxidoreductase subunit A [Chloroflexia bacterium]|nr:NADH-quinone oxidoreductase subunit A [Chloroflexia bacterium]
MTQFGVMFQATPVAEGTPVSAAADAIVRNQSNWLVVAVFFSMVLGIAVSMMLIPMLLAPKKPNPTKSMAYESGMPPIGQANQRYTVRYYVVAMLFVVFDIEAVFFYPWAVAFNAIGWYGLIEMVLFIVLLLIAYVYAWRKGALDWVS